MRLAPARTDNLKAARTAFFLAFSFAFALLFAALIIDFLDSFLGSPASISDFSLQNQQLFVVG